MPVHHSSKSHGSTKLRRGRKAPVKILSLRKTKNPINGVLAYAYVLSTSRPTRIVHNVAKVGRIFRCSCERNVLANERCIHIRAVAAKLARKAAR
jgi:hypothetical protein